MSSSNTYARAGARPLALGVGAAVLTGLATALVGTADAADLPQEYTPAPAPYVEQRVQSGFSVFRPYVGVRGGFAIVDDTAFAITAPDVVTTSYEDWNLTGSGFAGLETEFFPGFGGRIEGELGYATYEVESHSVGGVTQPAPVGDTSAFFGAVNAYVDANLGGFRPFAGAGIGMAMVGLNEHGAGGAVLMDDDDTGFLWQVSGGVGYDLTQNLTLEGMVRYQSVMDVELTSTAAGGSVGSSTDLNATSAQVGLRYRF